MNRRYPFLLLWMFSLGVLLSSCVARKDYTILYDMQPEKLYSIKYKELSKVQPEDRISILVMAKNNALALPFNTPTGSVSVGNEDLLVRSQQMAVNSGGVGGVIGQGKSSVEQRLNGYLVDNSGDILFPLLGRVHVAGLSTTEISELIRKKIIEGGYIADPMVETQYSNFRVYMITPNGGKVLQAQDERLNLLQAIAMGMPTGQEGILDKVAVIRKTPNGDNQMYEVNILNTDLFNSPVFYLQPNDVVYVKPKYKPAQIVELDNIFRYTSYLFTTIFTVTSIVNLFK